VQWNPLLPSFRGSDVSESTANSKPMRLIPTLVSSSLRVILESGVNRWKSFRFLHNVALYDDYSRLYKRIDRFASSSSTAGKGPINLNQLEFAFDAEYTDQTYN
jgi:hypothetical protein